MGSKHEILTEAELASYSISACILDELSRLQDMTQLPPEQINILDWGCGRGRSVALLRAQGFNAFGVDIDEATMRNGYDLFKGRGWDPVDLLRPVAAIDSFPDNFFHFIFSDQVLEHVSDMDHVARSIARLSSHSARAIHQFPGARTVGEVHLFMPLIHWLPKNQLRRVAIWLGLLCGRGPQEPWPACQSKPAWQASQVYFEYSINKTYYRDTRQLAALFAKHGFEVDHQVAGQDRWSKISPDFLRRNGFPTYQIFLRTVRRAA